MSNGTPKFDWRLAVDRTKSVEERLKFGPFGANNWYSQAMDEVKEIANRPFNGTRKIPNSI